jgi:SAM-dependent methyltransferase
MRKFQRSQALDFVQRFGLSGKRIIEVGCGDGNYLRYLHEAGAIPCGIEPSAPFRQMAAARGFQIADGYVARARTVPGAPFDAFVTRQVLEHVQDPNDFLLGIHRILSTEGVGLVEVPSLEQAIEGGRFYDFFPDHVNYFSVLTLRHALERNGFDVLEVARGMNGEFNIALVRKAPETDFVAMQNTINLIAEDLHEFVEKLHGQGKRVAVWGAGGKGLMVMAVAQLNSLAYVIDSDPHKHGRFTPVSHLRIFAPERLLTDPVDALILTALAYRDEILRQLRHDLRFEGTIAVLGPRLQVLEKEFTPSETAPL